MEALIALILEILNFAQILEALLALLQFFSIS